MGNKQMKKDLGYTIQAICYYRMTKPSSAVNFRNEYHDIPQ